MHKILLIEDDARLAEMVKDYLGTTGFDVEIAPNGSEGLSNLTNASFDAVLLDLMLPDMDGLDVCRKIREGSDTPVLMLTAKGDPMDRIIGIEIGADDYLPKPFEPRELAARLKAVLRRTKTSKPEDPVKKTRFGSLTIDSDSMIADIDGDPCNLTFHQFKLLELLANSAGRVLSRDQIMEQLSGTNWEVFDRSIDVHISRIRAEIEEDPKNPKRLITVRGAGYVFARVQD